MLKRLLSALVVVLWALPAAGELVDTAWVRFYNGPGNSQDLPTAVAFDFWGNVYVTGYSYGNGTERDYATIKYTPGGDLIWVRRYNGPANSDDWAEAMAVDPEGNVYVTGRSYGVETVWDCATVKYRPNGDTAWIRRYDGPAHSYDVGYDIGIDQKGYVYVVGTTRVSDKDYDCLAIKYCPDGDTVWMRRHSISDQEWIFANAVAVDDSCNVYLTGGSEGWGTELDYLTIKYYPDGEVAWVRRYDGPINWWDLGFSIGVDPGGNVHVTGTSWSERYRADYVTMKYDGNGNELWRARHNETPASQMHENRVVVNEGGVYMCGTAGPEGQFYQYVFIKYHPDGSLDWVRTYRSANSNSHTTGIALDIRGDVYVTGVGGYSHVTLKYGPEGDFLWVQEYPSPNIVWYDAKRVITVDLTGNTYVAGQIGGDYGVMKYVQFWYDRGDVNEDDEIDVLDVVYLIDYVLRSGPAPVPFPTLGDVNCDGSANVTDAVYLANFVFRDGPKPCL